MSILRQANTILRQKKNQISIYLHSLSQNFTEKLVISIINITCKKKNYYVSSQKSTELIWVETSISLLSIQTNKLNC